jgi:hypothetical protein
VRTERLREPFLHGVMAGRLIAKDRDRYPQKLPVPPTISRFKLTREPLTPRHHLNDAPASLFV